MADGIKLIVGLGNPGAEYADTRHNVGVWFVERVAALSEQTLKAERKFFGAVGTLKIDDRSVLMFVPSTYMNDSGKALLALTQFYKVPLENILVVHDELDFYVGKMKLKLSGGDGGHNGLRDIIAKLGSPHFWRLRIGIGHPGHRSKVTPYVLGRPSLGDRAQITQAIDGALSIISPLIAGDFAKAAQTLHEHTDGI